jgi:ABC-type branched-subunit amino acid transport system substrate-binding protein
MAKSYVLLCSASLLIVLLYAVACRQSNQTTTAFEVHSEIPEMKKPFIAVIGPKESCSLGHIGLSYMRGAFLAFKEKETLLNDRETSYIFLDDKSDIGKAKTFAVELSKNPNCLGIIGSGDSGSTIEIDKVTSSPPQGGLGLVLVSPVSSSTIIGKTGGGGINEWVFIVNPSSEQMIEAALDHLTKRIQPQGDVLNVTSVYAESHYGRGANNDLRNLCENPDNRCHYIDGVPMKIDYDSSCRPLGGRSMQSIIDRLKKMAPAPDAVGLFDPSPQAGVIALEIKEQIQNVRIFSTAANSTNLFFEKAGERGANGVIIATPYSREVSSTKESSSFKDKFKALFIEQSDNFAAQGYDAANLFLEALSYPPSNDVKDRQKGRETIRDALRSVKVDSIQIPGKIGFNHTQRTDIRPSILIWNENGELVPVNGKTHGVAEFILWFKSETAQTLIIFLILIVLFVAFARGARTGISKWAPLLITVISSGGLQAELVQRHLGLNINGLLLLALLFGAFVITNYAGYVSPRMFKEVARIQPFQIIASLALRIPTLRKQYFSGYTNELVRQLEDQTRGARGEKYVPIPAEVQERDGIVSADQNPAETIKGMLIKRRPEDRKHIIIEAPGGQGKTALLRSVVSRICDAYQTDPKIPLPILCSDSAGEIKEMVARSLGEYNIDESFLLEMLEAGYFIVFIDGLSEIGVNPEALGNYVRSAAGKASRLIVTMRPEGKLKKKLKLSDSWVQFQPLRLTETTLDKFVEAYCQAPSQSERRDSLPDLLKSACRSKDGEYLQILVRLALIIKDKDKEVSGVADLYSEALNELLKRNVLSKGVSNVISAAANICVKTYWEDGRRILTYFERDEEKEILQILRGAGVLIDVDSSHSKDGDSEPKTVKFFHDSIQSYLTARGLRNSGEDTTVLWRAAGDERFIEAFIHGQAPSQAELFNMCIEVFESKENLLKQMVSDLLKWSEHYGGDLALKKVLEAVPSELKAKTRLLVSDDNGAGFALKKAVSVCLENHDLDSRVFFQLSNRTITVSSASLQNTARLYRAIAPMTWKLSHEAGARE